MESTMSTTDTPAPTMIGLVGNSTDDPELLTRKSDNSWMKVCLGVKPFIPGAGDQPTEFHDLVPLSLHPHATLATVPPGGSLQPVNLQSEVPSTHRPPGGSRTEHAEVSVGAR
jgi:hypothetical protein